MTTPELHATIERYEALTDKLRDDHLEVQEVTYLIIGLQPEQVVEVAKHFGTTWEYSGVSAWCKLLRGYSIIYLRSVRVEIKTIFKMVK